MSSSFSSGTPSDCRCMQALCFLPQSLDVHMCIGPAVFTSFSLGSSISSGSYSLSRFPKLYVGWKEWWRNPIEDWVFQGLSICVHCLIVGLCVCSYYRRMLLCWLLRKTLINGNSKILSFYCYVPLQNSICFPPRSLTYAGSCSGSTQTASSTGTISRGGPWRKSGISYSHKLWDTIVQAYLTGRLPLLIKGFVTRLVFVFVLW